MARRRVAKNSLARVWIVEGGVGPGAEPTYEPCLALGDISWPQGDEEKIECPDPAQRDAFIEEDTIQGAVERATSTLTGNYPVKELARLLQLIRKRCRLDVQILWGLCDDPRNYNDSNRLKIAHLPATKLTGWNGEGFGTLSSGERAVTKESTDTSSREFFETVNLALKALAPTVIVRELVSVSVCDTMSCGDDCGPSSDGCSKVLAVQQSDGAAAKPDVAFSDDKGANVTLTAVDSMAATDTAKQGLCVGNVFVVLDATGNSIHIAPVDDILAGTETWAEVTTGFVATKTPNWAYSVASRYTWIAANGGYIYKMTTPGAGVTVQHAGVLSAQNLNDVHALDTDNVLVVGASNVVLVSSNGGKNWTLITGPAVGVSLTACLMYSENEWFVGTAAGEIWYTLDGGVTWVESALPVVASAITRFGISHDGTQVYALATVSAVGQILRNTLGGASDYWVVLPEGIGSVPTNTRLNDIAVCQSDENLIYAAGINTADGVLISGEPA